MPKLLIAVLGTLAVMVMCSDWRESQELKILDTYFYNFRDDPLRILLLGQLSATAVQSYWPSASIFRDASTLDSLDLIIDSRPSSEPLDALVSAFRGSRLLPGGLYIHLNPRLDVTTRLIDVLQRGSMLVAPSPSAWELGVKAVNVLQGAAPESPILLLGKKGEQDDHEFMTNGDDGLQYGEARHGLIARLIHRQFRIPLQPSRREYLRSALQLHEMPLSSVTATFKLPQHTANSLKLRQDAAKGAFPSDATEWRVVGNAPVLQLASREAVQACVLSDLEYALALPRSRLHLELLNSTHAAVTVRHGDEPEEYQLHRKRHPWTSWKEYFGSEAGATPLSVVAQTFREKWAMVSADDDQSDLYKGRCTRALVENRFREQDTVQVVVRSHNCTGFRAATEVHGLSCEPSLPSAAHSAPAAHSVLYQLFSKGKFDGYLGVPPVGEYERPDIEHPRLRSLEFDGDHAYYDGRPVGGQGVQALVAAKGGVGELLDYGAGQTSESPEVQTAGLKQLCPLVAPGGLCSFDGMFERPAGARAAPGAGGGYLSLRAVAEGLFKSSLQPLEVKSVSFITNNCVVVKNGALSPAKGPEPRLLGLEQDPDDRSSSEDEL